MKQHITFLALLLTLTCIAQSNLGKAIIVGYQPYYEDEDIYFPFDYFNYDSLCNKNPVEIKMYGNDSVIIKNNFNPCLSGIHTEFKLDKNLNIFEAKYSQWFDILVEGIEEKNFVEKAILEIDKNPFTDSIKIGHYTIQIRNEIYDDGKIDTTYFSTFSGKFKVYNEIEKKKNKKWVMEQEDLRCGNKDTSGLYLYTDRLAEYKFGKDSLENIFSKLNILKDSVIKTGNYFRLQFIVDETGFVDTNTIKFVDKDFPEADLNRIKNYPNLWNNWFPGEINGKRVKSLVTFNKSEFSPIDFLPGYPKK